MITLMGRTMRVECDDCEAKRVIAFGFNAQILFESATKSRDALNRMGWEVALEDVMHIVCGDCKSVVSCDTHPDPVTSGGGCRTCGGANWREVLLPVTRDATCPKCMEARFVEA